MGNAQGLAGLPVLRVCRVPRRLGRGERLLRERTGPTRGVCPGETRLGGGHGLGGSRQSSLRVGHAPGRFPDLVADGVLQLGACRLSLMHRRLGGAFPGLRTGVVEDGPRELEAQEFLVVLHHIGRRLPAGLRGNAEGRPALGPRLGDGLPGRLGPVVQPQQLGARCQRNGLRVQLASGGELEGRVNQLYRCLHCPCHENVEPLARVSQGCLRRSHLLSSRFGSRRGPRDLGRHCRPRVAPNPRRPQRFLSGAECRPRLVEPGLGQQRLIVGNRRLVEHLLGGLVEVRLCGAGLRASLPFGRCHPPPCPQRPRDVDGRARLVGPRDVDRPGDAADRYFDVLGWVHEPSRRGEGYGRLSPCRGRRDACLRPLRPGRRSRQPRVVVQRLGQGIGQRQLPGLLTDPKPCPRHDCREQ